MIMLIQLCKWRELPANFVLSYCQSTSQSTYGCWLLCRSSFTNKATLAWRNAFRLGQRHGDCVFVKVVGRSWRTVALKSLSDIQHSLKTYTSSSRYLHSSKNDSNGKSNSYSHRHSVIERGSITESKNEIKRNSKKGSDWKRSARTGVGTGREAKPGCLVGVRKRYECRGEDKNKGGVES